MAPTRVAALLALAVLLAGCGREHERKLPPGTIDFEAAFTTDLPGAVRPGTLVRIFGVDVGRVTGVERGAREVVVRMHTHRPDPRPFFVVHADAEIRVFPRITKPGAYFMDLRPGSPEAAELHSGDRIPASRTSLAFPPEPPALKVLPKPPWK